MGPDRPVLELSYHGGQPRYEPIVYPTVHQTRMLALLTQLSAEK